MRYSTPRPSGALVVLLTTLCVSAPAGAQAARPQQREPSGPALRVRESIVVTANRDEETLDRVGSSVTVIGAHEIEASGAVWLADVLARVPGLTLARSGGPGSVTSVFSRGSNSNHTLVLVNGLKANAPLTGAFDFANLPASQIDRVEIIRGPQSTLYGSNAIGAVINVITRRATRPAIELSADGGSFSTGRASARIDAAQGPLQLSLGADAYTSAGISAADESRGNRERDRFRNLSADVRAAYRPAGPWSAELFASTFDGTTRIDGFDFVLGPADDPDALQESRDLYGALTVGHDGARHSVRTTLSRTDKKLMLRDPSGFTTISELVGGITEFDIQATLRAGSAPTSAGVEHRRETARSRAEGFAGVSGYDEAVTVTGLYANHRRSWGRLDVGAGVRHESHSRFGDATTYRLTAAYRLASGWRTHGSLGTGFRAPAFNELFFPRFGNPELTAERSRGWDLGIAHGFAGGRGEIDVTWFRNEIDDLVEFTFPAGFVNLGEITTEGVEVSSGYDLGRDLGVDVNYTFTRARAVGSDEQLLRRPRHQASVVVRARPASRLRTFAELRYKGARRDFGVVAPLELEPYTVVNLAAQATLTSVLTATLRVDNVIDADYQEVWGFGTPGRSVFLGLRYRSSTR